MDGIPGVVVDLSQNEALDRCNEIIGHLSAIRQLNHSNTSDLKQDISQVMHTIQAQIDENNSNADDMKQAIVQTLHTVQAMNKNPSASTAYSNSIPATNYSPLDVSSLMTDVKVEITAAISNIVKTMPYNLTGGVIMKTEDTNSSDVFSNAVIYDDLSNAGIEKLMKLIQMQCIDSSAQYIDSNGSVSRLDAVKETTRNITQESAARNITQESAARNITQESTLEVSDRNFREIEVQGHDTQLLNVIVDMLQHNRSDLDLLKCEFVNIRKEMSAMSIRKHAVIRGEIFVFSLLTTITTSKKYF